MSSSVKSAVQTFIEKEKLPADYADTVQQWFLPLAEKLLHKVSTSSEALVVGISGCQGSGKSTLASLLVILLRELMGIKSVNLSIDDFYLSLFYVLILPLVFSSHTYAQNETKIIILGTGTPDPVLNRSGPSVAIVAGGNTYVFDAGGGMAKRAAEAALKFDMPELLPHNIQYLFLTHLHSDHIHDVSELASSRWWLRENRLKIWGPKGLRDYVESMTKMTAIEADIRSAGTPQQLITDREGFRTEATEIVDGIIFQNEDIQIEAFTVPHGEIRPAFGYKIITTDKSIVISGDTSFSELLAEKATGVDLLIHEVISGDRLAEKNEFWQQYHNASHTTADKLAAVANIAQPGLLVLTHIIFYGASADEIVAEVKRDYDGPVVLANDLDKF